MQLLDLPPEIFQRVVHVLVKKHGLKKAWKVRGTCKAFRTYITYETLATPSLYAYNKTRAGREILKHNLVDFLYIRSTTLNGFVRIHVPTFIRDVLLEMAPWVIGDEATSTLRKTLCELFVRNHADALKCVMADGNRLNKPFEQSIASTNTVSLVTAAAATGNLDALRKFAERDRRSLWAKSPAFGYPLDAVVYTGQFGIVKVIAQQAFTNQSLDVVDIQQAPDGAEHMAFRQAICTGIELQRNDIVTYLLGKYIRAFGPATEACLADWLDKAVTCSNAEMLRLLIKASTQAGAGTFYKAFETACRLAKSSLFRVFFPPNLQDLSRLSINQVCRSAYPILTAIQTGKSPHTTPIVKELLELGADPNGPRYLAGLVRPLQAAVRHGYGNICTHLLKAGANPHLVARKGWMDLVLRKYAVGTERGRRFRVAFKDCERPGADRVGRFLAEVEEEQAEVEDGELAAASR